MSADKKGGRKKPPALGRGLAALLGDEDLLDAPPPTEARPGEKILMLPLERVEPNPFQPRRSFEPKALEALAASIAEHGVLQPLVVRPVEGGYQLIAGERRLRASQMAGLDQVPVVVRQANDQQALVLALLENLQRADLNPLEEARAFQRLVKEFELSQGEVARGVGKDRTTVTNSLRLLQLPAEVQRDLAEGRLSAGHARCLLALASEAAMRKARDRIIAGGLSVRAAEALVKALNAPEAAPKAPVGADPDQVHWDGLEQKLRGRLGAAVKIVRKGKGGSIRIDYKSHRELERLLDLLGG